MRRMTAIMVLITVLFSIPVVPQSRALNEGLNAEQQRVLQQWFSRNSEFVGLSKQVIEQFLKNDHRFKTFLGDYADALTAVGVMNHLANAEDSAALQSVSLFVTEKAIGEYFPSMSNTLGWISWAKTGMQLFKDFVFDPALLQGAIDNYSAGRDLQLDPQAATANIRAIGNVKQQVLGKFRQQYGDSAFREISPSGLRLLPRWEQKFDVFFTAYFENQYQFMKLKRRQSSLKKSVKTAHDQIADELALMAERFARERNAGASSIIEGNTDPNGPPNNREGFITCPETKYPLVAAYTRQANPFDTATGTDYSPGKIGRTQDLSPKFFVECRYGSVGAEVFDLSVQWSAHSAADKIPFCLRPRWNVMGTWGWNHEFSSPNSTILIRIGRRFEGGNNYSNPLNSQERDAAASYLIAQVKPLAFPCKKTVGQ